MRIRGLVTNLSFNIALPLIAVNVLQARGIRLVTALVIAGIFPALEVAYTALRRRRLEPLGVIVLALIATGAAASLVSGDVHFALAKESLGTGIFGLLCLGSFLAERPLMFYVGRTFTTGNDEALVAEWNARWALPLFRHTLRVITAAWGIGFVIEAAVRVLLAYTLAASVVLVASPTLALATTAGLVAWTTRYAASAERRGQALQDAAQAAPEG